MQITWKSIKIEKDVNVMNELKKVPLEFVKDEYLRKIYSDLEFLLYKILFHGAPTFFSHKPSSLIILKNTPFSNLKEIWDNKKGEIKNLISHNYTELKTTDKCVHILFYKSSDLEQTIFKNDISEYLKSKNYPMEGTLNEILISLKHNFSVKCPDEIGIFLGYPLSDVLAFTSTSKCEAICVGYWRVYSNLSQARDTFTAYDKARFFVSNLIKKGQSPLSLLEAV